MRPLWVLAVVGHLLAGCGSSKSVTASAPDGTANDASSPETTVAGTVGGIAVQAAEAIGLFGKDSVTGVPYAGTWIQSQTGTCAAAQRGAGMAPGATRVTIELARTAGTDPIAAGSYPFTADNGAAGNNGIALFAQFTAYDTSCNPIVIEDAKGGGVTLDTVNATEIAGSFDIGFGAGDGGIDHLTGTFHGPVCNFDMNLVGTSDAGDACPAGPIDQSD